jgi:hypothetical protein
MYSTGFYIYLCNQCLSPLTLWVRIPLRRGVIDKILCDKVCQCLMAGWWFSTVIYIILFLQKRDDGHKRVWRYQGFQSGPVPGTFTRLRSCKVPAEITEPPNISGGQNHKYDPHAQTAIYDSKVKLFLKQGISRQLGRDWMQLFDLNARIQQLTWSLINSDRNKADIISK